jgi:hypothetical protein
LIAAKAARLRSRHSSSVPGVLPVASQSTAREAAFRSWAARPVGDRAPSYVHSVFVRLNQTRPASGERLLMP